MALNPILSKKKDRALAKSIRQAFRDGHCSQQDLIKIFTSALDGDVVTDVEYRDLKKLMRTELRLTEAHRLALDQFLQLFYPLEGPFIYPGDVKLLQGAEQKDDGSCAKLVQLSQPIGLTRHWREGIRVQGNDHLIDEGTAVATFEDGFYPNRDHDNHVAYYISQNTDGVLVMDQYSNKNDISQRRVEFKRRRADGTYVDPSNNGAALSVIMRKPR
jgi:hypothetical protein